MKADTELEAAVGTQDADGYSLSLFGSVVPIENAYVDGILTVGRNNYDSERRTSTGALASDTKGDQWESPSAPVTGRPGAAYHDAVWPHRARRRSSRCVH